jgi:hypothetical protein
MRTIVFGLWGIVAAVPAGAQILPPDPVFSNSFDSGVVSLSPSPVHIAQGASGNTLPTALMLTLSAPAVSDTFVPVVSAEPARLGVTGGGVTVLAGQSSAAVPVSGLIGGAAPVTLTATLGNRVAAGVRVEAALNDAGAGAGEAEFCNIQFPLVFDISAGQLGPSIFGQLFQAGITEPAGAPAGWIAALGYGPLGTDPRLLAGWQFFDAGYNTQVFDNDEFMASFTAPWAAGVYAYAFRFSQDAGVSWTYCDGDGAGADPGLLFDVTWLGQMTVEHSLTINEIDYDNVGAIDVAEFVEIYNAGPTAVDLSGIALVLVNGNDNNEYRRVDLGAAGSLAAGGYLVVHDGAVSLPAGTLSLTFPGCTETCIQNGAPDGVALIDTVGHVVIDALSYEGSIIAANIGGFPAAVSLVEGTALSGAVVDGNVSDGSLIRNPNGADTDNADDDWSSTTSLTPGAANLP